MKNLANLAEEEILTGNKLIAEFMGFTSREGYPNELYNKDDIYQGNPKNFKYHTSFNWIFPVIDKIESLCFSVIIKRFRCEIDSNNFNIEYSQHYSSGADRNIFIWWCVVEFIKWFNQQPK